MGIFPIFHAFKKQPWESSGLTETHRRMYTAEKLENFRWISKLVATYSKYQLSEEDLVSEDLCQWLREVGQFAESVYAAPPLELLLKRFISLNQPGFPLERYYALSPQPYRTAAFPFPLDTCSQPREHFLTSGGVQLLRSIKGQVASLPAVIFSRWIHEYSCPSSSHQENANPKARIRCSCSRRRQQIIVSICGTSSLQQAIHDLRAIRRPYPGVHEDAATVHTGFWDLYQGMKSDLMEGIVQGLRRNPFEDRETEHLRGTNDSDVLRELIVTGHSMGGAIAHLLCLDLLSSTLDLPENTNPRNSIVLGRTPGSTNPSLVGTTSCNAESFLQHSRLKSLEIVTFGEPRSGNQALVDHWVALKKRHQDEYNIPIREYCVKAYNDGVVSLPLIKFGYRHFSQEPLYTINGKVYRIPSDERECALFHVYSSHPPVSSPSTSQPGLDSDHLEIVDTYSSRTASYPTHNLASNSSVPLFPLGGHNYYNGRDLEGGYLRRIEWFEKSCFDQEGWEERYRKFLRDSRG